LSSAGTECDSSEIAKENNKNGRENKKKEEVKARTEDGKT
jgi:hypothetical protein